MAGGCIHECYRVGIGGARRFLKINDSRYADAFAAEADGLGALRGSGLRAPAPIAQGKAYLLLEHLRPRQEEGGFIGVEIPGLPF